MEGPGPWYDDDDFEPCLCKGRPVCLPGNPCPLCTDYDGKQHSVGEYFYHGPDEDGWEVHCLCSGFDCADWIHVDEKTHCNCHRNAPPIHGK